tara:strand:- start:713 stop:1129 length:417 start_codon:yes stop_codon:yes gene_type:complete
MKRLLLPLIAALALPTAVEAEFVLPWNKLEPTHSNIDSAMKACAIKNERILKEGDYNDLLETTIDEEVINGKNYRWVTKIEILNTECKSYETQDPNIGKVMGKVYYLQSEFENGKLLKAPEVNNFFLLRGNRIFFPYK